MNTKVLGIEYQRCIGSAQSSLTKEMKFKGEQWDWVKRRTVCWSLKKNRDGEKREESRRCGNEAYRVISK